MSENDKSSAGTGTNGTTDWKAQLQAILRKAWTQPDGRSAVLEVIRKFLTDSQEGRKLVQDVIYKHFPPQHPVENPLLCLIQPDGVVELYGDRTHKVHFYTMPPFHSTAEVRKKAEELLEVQLPPRLKELYWPHATDTHPGMIDRAQIAIKNTTGRIYVTWKNCENLWLDDVTP